MQLIQSPNETKQRLDRIEAMLGIETSNPEALPTQVQYLHYKINELSTIIEETQRNLERKITDDIRAAFELHNRVMAHSSMSQEDREELKSFIRSVVSMDVSDSFYHMGQKFAKYFCENPANINRTIMNSSNYIP